MLFLLFANTMRTPSIWPSRQKVGCLHLSIMSGKVLVNEFDSMHSSQSAMYSQFRFDVRKDSLQSVVRVWQPDVGIVVESPEQWHVPFDAQVCAS